MKSAKSANPPHPMFRPISRRTMLRGCGAALALPLMEAMTPKLKAEERLVKPPLRSAFFFMPNGVNESRWRPAGTGEKFELSPSLQSLKNVKDQIIVLENLTNKRTAGRNGHWPKVPAWLHGGFVRRSTGQDIDVGGVSIDQVMADEIGNRTPLPSFELGLEPTRTGVDNVDLAAASARGIKVLRAEGANARGVAELAFGQVLAAARGLCAADAELKAGAFVEIWSALAGNAPAGGTDDDRN